MHSRTYRAPIPRPAAVVTATQPASRVPGSRLPMGRPAGVPRFAATPTSVHPAAAPMPETPSGRVVQDVIRSGGRPLEKGPRMEFEQQLGHDLSRVRVHADARAAASARALGARAFAVGRHVVFGAGEFAPATTTGRQLLAHELVHTVQQGQAIPTGADSPRVAGPREASEQEAERIARHAHGPAVAPVAVTSTALQLAAQPAPVGGAARQRVEQAARLLQQTSNGPATLNDFVESRTLIELRHAGGGVTFFRIGNPLKQTDRNTWVRDDHTFTVHEVPAAPGDPGPRVVLEEGQSLGDLALSLFRGQNQLRGSAHAPAALRESIRQDDRAAARAAYVQAMTGSVVHDTAEQLAVKTQLLQQGAAVSTPLPLEAEYQAARTQGFMSEMQQSGRFREAGFAAIGSGYQAVRDAVGGGKMRAPNGAKYADHFGQEWDRENAAWTQREPQKAAEGQVRHETATTIKTLAQLTNRTPPKARHAFDVIAAIDAFALQFGGTSRILFMAEASAGLERLLGPFGYRTVYGTHIERLMHQRLDYALANYRALGVDDRRRLLDQPGLAGQYGINQSPTQAELTAESRIVSMRNLPDGSPHTGTRAEYQAAVEAQRIQHALDQIDQIRNSGPISLAGRAVGGEKGAAIGAVGDAVVMLRTPRAARRQQQRLARQGGGGGAAPASAPLEPIAHRAPAPARTPMPAPRPTPVVETEVVATHARSRSAVTVQTPDVHQANWARFGGEGTAPPAYRHAGNSVYLSSASWLVAPATRAGIPPVRPTPGVPAPAPAATPRPDAPARPPAAGRGQPDLAFEKTGQPDPFAQTPPAPAPAAGQPASSRLTPASNLRPRFRFNPEVPPQPISAERLAKLSNLARFTVDSTRHQQAWELLGGRGTAPPAFISEKVIYLDPSRWPPR